MGKEERATGTANEVYDLVSVLYHALEAGVTSQQYIDDAELADKQEVAEFFRQLQQEDRDRADRAKQLLGQELR